MVSRPRLWPALDLTSPSLTNDPHTQARLYAALDEFGLSAIEERDEDTWRVFFGSTRERDHAAAALREAPGIGGVRVDAVEVPDEDWARRTQADVRQVRVGRIIVAPPWDLPPSPSPALLIIIEPSMGFGTGHHPSTRLCLGALQQIDLRGRSMLDVGTGSGVLALAAARLGARPVVAVDVDPDAVASARDNAALNDLAADIDLRVADIQALSGMQASVVTANLTGALLVREAAPLAGIAEDWLVLAGLTRSEEATITGAFAPFARVVWRDAEEDWVGLVLARSFPDVLLDERLEHAIARVAVELDVQPGPQVVRQLVQGAARGHRHQ